MKIPFVDLELYRDSLKQPATPTSDDDTTAINTVILQTKSRASTIIDNFVGKTISVYNGRVSKRVYIKQEMIGFKLGCFCFTKKLGKSIHNSEHNRKKKEKMRRKITQKKVRKTTVTNKKSRKPVKKKK